MRSSGGGLFFLVLTLGMILTRFKTIGLGFTFQLPFTSFNFTAAWTLGAKGKAADALPAYVRGKLGGNEDFINSSRTMTIGPAEGIALTVIGNQPGAPARDFYFALV